MKLREVECLALLCLVNVSDTLIFSMKNFELGLSNLPFVRKPKEEDRPTQCFDSLFPNLPRFARNCHLFALGLSVRSSRLCLISRALQSLSPLSPFHDQVKDRKD